VAAGVISALFYGQSVLVPVALAMLLSFLLTPMVRLFERVGGGRVVSALAVVVLVGVIVWTVPVQKTADLVAALAGYRVNIQHKIEDVRSVGRGRVARASD
jgi:predicted PurR-regulated permease PerM